MAGIPESLAVDITCPHCKKKSSQGVAKLRRDRELTCPGCGAIGRLEGNELDEIDRAFRDLQQTLAKGASVKLKK